MLFSVTKKYLQGQDKKLIVEWIHGCLFNLHFIDCDKECIDYIKDIVQSDSSLSDKDCFSQRKEIFDVPDDLRTRLTVVNAKNFNMKTLLVLSSEPAVLVLENIQESDVYKLIVHAYCKDKTYGCLYKHLYRRMLLDKVLTFQQAGGYSEIPRILKYMEEGKYGSTIQLKSLSVFDRDTDSALDYDGNKNLLFRLFLGKESGAVQESDIYTLNQQPYHWHMWYKRAIENYFPIEQFKRAGCKLKPDYDRTKPEDYMPVKQMYMNYEKNNLRKLAKGMVCADFERRLHSFSVNGELLSEFQLFIFKIMQTI